MRKNSITLKKSKLDSLIRKSIQEQIDKIIKNGFKKRNLMEEEGFFFNFLWPGESGLAVPILYDVYQCYIEYNHPLWIYFRNSYDNHSGAYMAITVSDNPRVITKGRKIRISKSDLIDIINFVIRNQKLLKEISDYRAIDEKLDNKIKVINEDYKFEIKYDGKFYGYNIYPQVTGLPFKIFVSPKSKHDIGVKFPPNRDYINADSREFAEMQVSDYRVRSSKAKLDSNFEKRMRDYIILNQKTFEEMRDKEKMEALIANLIKVDKDGKPIKKEHKVFVCDKEYCGFTKVRNEDGKFNFINRKNELLSETWFDTANNFKQTGKTICAIVEIGDNYYYVFKDGSLRIIQP
jgi:hypothetical protein